MAPGPPGNKNIKLKPEEIIGVAIAVCITVLVLAGLLCCAARRGLCYHGAQAMRRRIDWDGEQYHDHKNKKDKLATTTLHNIGNNKNNTTNKKISSLSQQTASTNSSSSQQQPSYVDQKAELPASTVPRFEIDGVGRSAAAGKAEMDGVVEAVELPATPARSSSSSSSTAAAMVVFRYSANPSYSLGGSTTVSSPDGDGGEEQGRGTFDGEVSPLSPVSREKLSLVGIAEQREEVEDGRRKSDELWMHKC